MEPPDDDWVDGDYPTEAALTRLETWPYEDVAGALDFAKEIWHWYDWACHELRPEEALVVHAEPGEKFLRLATGGWSGNESIVSALNRNRMLTALAWCLDARGGLHIYKYPPPTSRDRLRLNEEVQDEERRVSRA